MKIKEAAKRIFLSTGLLQPFLVNGRFYMYFSETVLSEKLNKTSLGRYLNRKWDPQETELIEKHMKSGMIGLDIGANIGYYALMMSQKCKKVYAFEPQPKVYKLLERNIRINKLGNKIEPVMKGAYNKKTRLRFDKVEISVLRLDDFFKNKPKPDIIKIDVDGAEVEAISGGNQTFRNAKLVLYEDMTRDNKVGKKLESIGFICKRINKINCVATKPKLNYPELW